MGVSWNLAPIWGFCSLLFNIKSKYEYTVSYLLHFLVRKWFNLWIVFNCFLNYVSKKLLNVLYKKIVERSTLLSTSFQKFVCPTNKFQTFRLCLIWKRRTIETSIDLAFDKGFHVNSKQKVSFKDDILRAKSINQCRSATRYLRGIAQIGPGLHQVGVEGRSHLCQRR